MSFNTETVLKTHEKLLNKFQNTDDDSENDENQTIFNSVNTGYTAHDFVRSYAPQASIYSDVPSSTMSLNRPPVDNAPLKKKSSMWTEYIPSNNENDDYNNDDDDDVPASDVLPT